MQLRWIFTTLLLCACADAQAQTNPRITCAGVNQGRPLSIDFAGTAITSCTAGPSNLAINLSSAAGSGAPTNSTYITQTPDPTLSAEQAMSLLGTGLVKNTTGSGVQSIYTGTSCAYAVKSLDAAGAATCTAAPAAGAPASAGYWTKTADATLSNEFDMSSLATGILLNTTTTGVPTIYAGTSCAANQYMNALDASGVKTCAQVATSQLSGTVTNAQLASSYSGTGACAASKWVSTLNGNAAPTCTQPAYSDLTGAPTIPADISAASYITKVAEASLSNEFAMGSLATGIVKNTTTTGVPSIAVAGTDYAAATSGSAVLLGNGAGGFSNYAGTSCTNQFNRSLSTAGVATCAGVGVADFTANQGTTTQVLHGNAAGQPSWAAVADGDITPAYSGTGACGANTWASTLTRNASPTCTQPGFSNLSGSATNSQLPVVDLAHGGTNKNNTASNGAIIYSDASTFLPSAVGTAGQGFYSGGAGAPTWVDDNKIVRLTADYTNATTTLSNTALTWTSPAAVSRSAFECRLMVKSSATTTGGQFDVLVATVPTTITYELEYVTAAGTAPSTGGTKVFVQVVAGSTLLGPAATSLTTYTLWRLSGIIVHTSTASAVTVRGKAGAAGTLTVGSGSYCTYYTL